MSWDAGELAKDANSSDALRQRVQARTLTWRGPALMLFARSVFAVGAQALAAGYPAFILGGVFATGWLLYGTRAGEGSTTSVSAP